MLLLCLISAAVFVWVLYVGKGEYQESDDVHKRNDSYDIRETMNVHCGFVKGRKPGHGTGFDMDDNDLLEMEQCHGVVVASAIFVLISLGCDAMRCASIRCLQKYHKEVLARLAPPPPPPQYSGNDPSKVFSGESGSVAARKVSPRRRRDRKSGSRHHRKVSREMVVSQIKD
ncbi:hypothetical protein V6N13_048573 [Hibiscus sabdariffa]